MTEQAKKPDIAGESLQLVSRVQRIVSIAQPQGEFWFERDRISPALLAKKKMQLRQVRADATAALDDKHVLIVGFEYALQGLLIDDTGADEEILGVRAFFEIVYQLSEGPAPSNETLQAFAKVNAQFNLTAFWREYVHSCFTRAGLPSFEVPPFNASKALEELRTPPAATVAKAPEKAST